jgi:hypothetical protein
VLLPLLGGAGLLAVMVVVEGRAPEPLIPVRFFANRTRVTSNVLSLALIGIGAGIGVATALMPRVGLLVFGVFSGICYPGLINGALHQVTGQDAGLGSGVQTAMQQIGSALGLATLVTLALRYAGDQVRHGVPAAVAQTQGYALSFRVGAAILAAAGLLALVLLEKVTANPRTALAEAPADRASGAPTVSRAAR